MYLFKLLVIFLIKNLQLHKLNLSKKAAKSIYLIKTIFNCFISFACYLLRLNSVFDFIHHLLSGKFETIPVLLIVFISNYVVSIKSKSHKLDSP